VLVSINAVKHFLALQLLKKNLVSVNNGIKIIKISLIANMDIQYLLLYDLLRLVVIESNVPVHPAFIVNNRSVCVVHHTKSKFES
jgi:hypothetical protein